MRVKAAALAEAEEKVRSRLTQVEQQLAALHTAVMPISTAMQNLFIQRLTNLHTPELDSLLSKIHSDSLTEKQEQRLFKLLEDTANNVSGDVPEMERDAAIMLPLIRKMVKAEKHLMNTVIQVVSIPPLKEDINERR